MSKPKQKTTVYNNATPEDARQHALALAEAIEKVAAQGGSGNFVLSLDEEGKIIERIDLGAIGEVTT